MKKLLLALALLLLPVAASAQCTGVFTDGTVCGNATGANNTPRMTAVSAFIPYTSLTQYHFLIGNASNKAADTALAGDCTYGASGIICTKTNGVAFNYFATGTDLSHLTGSLTANLPLIGSGGAIGQGTRSGNTTSFGTTSGSLVNGNCVKADASGNLVDAGVTCAGSSISGFYTLQYISGAWTCTNPTGGAVSIVGSTTSGAQECINAMQSAKTGNFRAICPNPASGIYISASTTITIGPSAGALYDLGGCWLITVASPGVKFETLNFGASVNWPGIISCTGSPCVDFNPTLPDPLFGSYGIGGAYFKLGSVMTSGCASDSAQSSGVHFNPNGGVAGSHVLAIYASKIEIGFIDGYDGAHNCFQSGIAADNPTNIFAAFGQNYIYAGYIQGFGSFGVQNGTSALTPATQALATNHWDIGTIGSSNGATTTPVVGFKQYGFLDQIYANISINSGSLTIGLDFAAATANGNWFVIPQLDGTTALTDSATTVKNYGFSAGTGYKTGGSW